MKASKAVSRFSVLAIAVIFGSHVISASAGVNHAVTTSGLTFSPPALSISAGDSVTWNNLTGGGHSTTSSNSLWSSSSDGFTMTFSSSGTFGYYCIPHHSFGMTGTITVNATANVPPTVSLTSPAAGTIFAAPANVTIQATAADSDGSVTNVQFLVGSVILANKAASPFSVTTNNLPAGTYILSAIAADNLGAKATNTVNIIVDALPTVTITNPVSGTTLSAPASLILKANAADADGSIASVKFLQGATTLGTATTAPY
jgi:plastocyanin